jgi:HSP20 family protein
MKTVTLYRPKVLESALSDFDRYMDSFFFVYFLKPSERVFNRLPAVDIRETKKAYILEAELPGFDEKNIEIRLDGGNLTIEAKKAEEKNDNSAASVNESYLIQERRISSFSRSFRLPENAEIEGISASFRNGILSLEIAKKVEAQARLIPITKD